MCLEWNPKQATSQQLLVVSEWLMSQQVAEELVYVALSAHCFRQKILTYLRKNSFSLLFSRLGTFVNIHSHSRQGRLWNQQYKHTVLSPQGVSNVFDFPDCLWIWNRFSKTPKTYS